MGDATRRAGELEAAVATPLDGTVAVAPGGIVSRQLLRRRGGNLTVFALDAGQSIEPHSSPYDAVVIPWEGEVELEIGGKAVVAHEGEAVLMPAGVPHGLRTARGVRFLLVMLRGEEG